MSERLDRLLREIEAQKSAALADLGLAFDGPLLVVGDTTPAEVIQRRLQRVPEAFRQEASARMTRSIVRLPWLQGRQVSGAAA